MEKIVEQGLLYDFYGELLTEHQRRIYEDMVFNDLSPSEIAKEQGISRLNEILCHDLTLSVGEPDNAAAKQGQELRSEQTVIPLHEQYHLFVQGELELYDPETGEVLNPADFTDKDGNPLVLTLQLTRCISATCVA